MSQKNKRQKSSAEIANSGGQLPFNDMVKAMRGTPPPDPKKKSKTSGGR